MVPPDERTQMRYGQTVMRKETDSLAMPDHRVPNEKPRRSAARIMSVFSRYTATTLQTLQPPLERVKQNSLSARDRIISQPDSPTWRKHASYHIAPFPSPRLQVWSEQPAKGDGDVRHFAFIGWRRDRPTHKARRVIPYERSGRNSLLRHPNLGYINQYSGTDSRT